MTATYAQPAQPVVPPGGAPAGGDPTRSPLGRGLLWFGAGLGVVALGWGALQAADVLLASTDVATATYDAAPVVELVADGRVAVVASDGDVVDVERSQRSGFFSPVYEVSQGADRLVVRNECDSWFGVCSGSLAVQLPEGTEVVVRTSNGDVVASGLVGPLDVETSNGRVEAAEVRGDARLHSSNGDVEVGDVTGSLDARSSNGRIDVRGVGGDVDAVTSNGDVQVDDVGGDAMVRSSNGAVDVSAVGGDVEAVSSNGDVTVVGDGTPVALTISTSNGQQIVEGPTDPTATRSVVVRSSSGTVAYLAPR